MEIHEEIAGVRTREEFIKFLKLLIDDSREKSAEWDCKDIPQYLESIQSWIEDMDGYYENNNLEIPNNVDWELFATVFYVGKIYE